MLENYLHIDSWVVLGLSGQLLFFLSFAVQWYKSEKAKRSVLPKEFWWLRLAASLLMIAYVFHRQDPVFIIATICQVFMYLRNIVLAQYTEL